MKLRPISLWPLHRPLNRKWYRNQIQRQGFKAPRRCEVPTREQVLALGFRYNAVTGELSKHGAILSGTNVRLYEGKYMKPWRLAWLLATGEKPNVIDHLNGDPRDNRLENLRNTDMSGNARNVKQRADNTSGIKGVSYNSQKRRWVVQTTLSTGKREYKTFKSLEKAEEYRLGLLSENEYTERHGFVGVGYTDI